MAQTSADPAVLRQPQWQQDADWIEQFSLAFVAGGAFVLAAMKVPEAEFDRVAAQVNAFPEVAHNYRRDHALNMWFVLATATPEGIAETTAAIEADTGLAVFAFPKEREYFVEMKLRA